MKKKDIANRFETNPLLKPADLQASGGGLGITCLLNPGVFQYQDKTRLVVRVAKRSAQKEGIIFFPVLTDSGKIKIIEMNKSDPELISTNSGGLKMNMHRTISSTIKSRKYQCYTYLPGII